MLYHIFFFTKIHPKHSLCQVNSKGLLKISFNKVWEQKKIRKTGLALSILFLIYSIPQRTWKNYYYYKKRLFQSRRLMMIILSKAFTQTKTRVIWTWIATISCFPPYPFPKHTRQRFIGFFLLSVEGILFWICVINAASSDGRPFFLGPFGVDCRPVRCRMVSFRKFS